MFLLPIAGTGALPVKANWCHASGSKVVGTHCHQGSVLLYVKCGPSTIIAIAIGRNEVGTIARWKAGTIAVVATASTNSVAGAVSFHCPVPHVSY